MEFYAAKRKKELLPCAGRDGTGEHYAKWSKPGSEREIPYDLTFKWHLIKKKWTSKQNITRDIEIKNNLTVTRGEVGWDNGGKGFQKLL